MSPNPRYLSKPGTKTARDLMTPGAECIGENEPVLRAARKMAELDVGALPICGADDRLTGMLTDRDIVIKVLAAGKDPADPTGACATRAGTGSGYAATGSSASQRCTSRATSAAEA